MAAITATATMVRDMGMARLAAVPTAPGQSTWGTERVLVCSKYRADNAADSRFYAQCGQRLGPADQTCGKCGTMVASGAKFYPF